MNRRKTIRQLLLLMPLALTAGCTTTVTRTEFNRIYMSALSNKLGAVYYLGREDGYDFFRTVRAKGPGRIRVEAGKSPVLKPFPFTTDPAKWTCASHNQLDFSTPISDDDLKKLGIMLEPDNYHPPY